MSEGLELAHVGGTNGVADLIFVHGLTGNYFTTWNCPGSGDPSGDYWPRW
jgi:protein SERAC1